MLNLYDQYGELKACFEPDDSSEQIVELQSGNELSLSFTMCECVVFEVNDYIDFEGTRFWVLEQYYPDQTSTVEWEYSVSLYGVESIVQRYLVLKLSNDEYEPIFSYTATAQGHMELIVAALNDGMGTTDWKVGEVVSTDYIIIDYSSTYCNTALSNLASKAGTEFWFENGMTINLTQAEHSEEITLAYGNGLLNLYREKADNVAFFTRFIPIGSSRNIVYDDYGYTRLQLPDKSKYIDIDVDKYGVMHATETNSFSDIYPRRIGTISSVRAEACLDDNGDTFYVYYVTDDTLDFDPNDYIMSNLVIKMTFQSGDLNGQGDFEVNYNSTTKEFEMINQYPYDDATIQLPGSLLMAKGDTYVLWNLEMPSEYRDLAEIEYEEAVYAYIEAKLKDIGIYKGTTDYVELEKRDIILTIGQRIRLESTKYFPSTGYKSTRITKLTRNVNYPKTIDVEISDVLSTGTIDKINDDLTTVQNYTQQAVSDLPDVVKSWESTSAADTNLYSAKKSVKEFLSKLNDDTVQGIVTFLKKIIVNNIQSDNFDATLKAGYGFTTDENGRSTLTIGKINAEEFAVDILTYNEVQSAGGTIVVSKTWAEVSRVEVIEGALTVYYIPKLGAQSWQVTDQPRMAKDGRYFWGVVTAVSNAATEAGEFSFTCSALAANIIGSADSVQEGDTMILYGHRGTDKTRQSLTVISAGDDANSHPYIKQYRNIDSFDLTNLEDNNESTSIGYDTQIGIKGARSVYKTDEKAIYHYGDKIYYARDEESTPTRMVQEMGAHVEGETYFYYQRVTMPDGSLFLCIAENGTTETPSKNSDDWMAQGSSVEILSTAVTYAQSTDGSTPPTDGWSESTPADMLAGNYLWTKTFVDYSTGDDTTSYSVTRWGVDGSSVTVSSTSISYAVSSSGITTPTTGWQTSIPSVPASYYLWTRTIVAYSDGKFTTAYSVSRQGADGNSIYQVYKRAVAQPDTPDGIAYPPEGWATSTDGATYNVFAISFSLDWTPSAVTTNTFSSYFEFCDSEGNNTSSVATVDTKFYKFKDGVDNTTIPAYAFRGSSSSYGITSIEIPSTVTTISNYAFYYQRELIEIILPPNVTYIGTYAFRYCYSLTSVRFYGDVTYIGTYAFYTCSALTKIELLNNSVIPTLGSSYSLPSNTGMEIYVPSTLYSSFISASYWSAKTSYLVSSDTGYTEDYVSSSDNTFLWASIANTTDGEIDSWGTPYKMEASDGAAGKGILSTDITYASGSSGTTAPTSEWSSSIPSVPAGYYLWTRTILTYTDDTTSTSYTIARQGSDGNDATVTDAQILAIKNDLAYNLGYTGGFTEMEEAYSSGETIISGRYINTGLISAYAIVTAYLAAAKITATQIDAAGLNVTGGTIEAASLWLSGSFGVSINYASSICNTSNVIDTDQYTFIELGAGGTYTLSNPTRTGTKVQLFWTPVQTKVSQGKINVSGSIVDLTNRLQSSTYNSISVDLGGPYSYCELFYLGGGTWNVLSKTPGINLGTTGGNYLGLPLNVLAMGRITGSSSTASLTFYSTFDGSTLSVSRSSTGTYVLTLPSDWFTSTYHMGVTATGYYSSGVIKAAVQSLTTTSVTFGVSDDDSKNDGYLLFSIYTTNKWTTQ